MVNAIMSFSKFLPYLVVFKQFIYVAFLGALSYSEKCILHYGPEETPELLEYIIYMSTDKIHTISVMIVYGRISIPLLKTA